MNNKISLLSIASTILISSSVNAFWGNDLSIEKERAPVSPEWVQKNDGKVMRKVFEIDKSALTEINSYIAETKYLFKLKYIDFNALSTLDPTQLKLSNKSKEADLVNDKYVELINSVKAIIGMKIQEKQQAVIENEILSKNYAMEIASLEEKQQGYRAAVKAIYDLKDEVIKAQALSEQTIKYLSSDLVARLNQHSAMSKQLISKYFQSPKVELGSCDDTVIFTKTSMELNYEVQDFCFTNKFGIEKNSADSLLNDPEIMTFLESKLKAIALEKIKQGDLNGKKGGKPGYKQQITAFSRGGIENFKKAAKVEFGNTDKGFSFKVKNITKKLASNNRKIKMLKKDVLNVPVKVLKRSEELKALKPLSQQLDALIEQYFVAYFANIIGEPIKESSEDYKLIEFDEYKGLLLIEDSYTTDTNDQLEIYLINPSALQQNNAIKKHFDGKTIPVRAAVQANGLLIWAAKDVTRIAMSLKHFLSNK